MKKTSLVETKVADYTCTAADSGKTFIAGAVDLTFTLPLAENGLNFRFTVGTASVTTGLIIDGSGAELINGAATLTNTGATDAVGDALEVWSDGTGWYTTSKIGTWA